MNVNHNDHEDIYIKSEGNEGIYNEINMVKGGKNIKYIMKLVFLTNKYQLLYFLRIIINSTLKS